MIARDGVAFIRCARRVRAELDQRKRYAHVLGVARTAARLARVHGIDPQRARTAGMLHDLARLWSAPRLLEACAHYGLAIDPFEREHPIVLHARVGAELARERYGITDDEILGAIRLHTVGAAGMTPLEEIVYLADALEPGRTFPERAEFFALALQDRKAGMRAVLGNTLAYLARRGEAISPLTRAALDRYAVPTGGIPAA